MTMRTTWRPGAIGLIAAGFAASPAVAQVPEYTITLTNSFFAEAIEASVQKELEEHKELSWEPDRAHVEVWQTNEREIGARANLLFEESIAEIDLTFTLSFACYFQNPRLSMAAHNFEVDTNFPVWVDIASGGVTLLVGELTDSIVNSKDEIIGRIHDRVNSQLNSQNGSLNFEVCPRISAGGGDVELHFVTGEECTSGEEVIRPCQAGENGKGRNSFCINGWWEHVNDCGSIHKLTEQVGS